MSDAPPIESYERAEIALEHGGRVPPQNIDPEWAARYAKSREAQRANLKKPDPWDEEEPDVFEQIGGGE